MSIKKFYSGRSFEPIYLDILSNIRGSYEYMGEGRGEVIFFEITNLSFELMNPYDRFVWNAARRVNYEFAMRFFLWMLDGADDFAYVSGVNPNAASYIDQNKLEAPGDAKFSTAYGPRIMRQIGPVIDELKRNNGSRRAVISILDDGDLVMLPTDTKEEFPCIESMTFYIREDYLHCQVNMRSNNMCTTVVYDVFCFTLFQEVVLKRLQPFFPDLKMGVYRHHCTSAHYFANQAVLVDAILENKEEAMLFRADKNKREA